MNDCDNQQRFHLPIPQNLRERQPERRNLRPWETLLYPSFREGTTTSGPLLPAHPSFHEGTTTSRCGQGVLPCLPIPQNLRERP